MSALYEAPVYKVYGRKPVKGLRFGIEVEMEPILNQPPAINREYQSIWDYKGDGSLRNHGIEAITSPITLDRLDQAMEEFTESLDLDSFDPTSPRTSVHVHVNYSDKTLSQVTNAVCLYILFEDLLLELSGRTRKGNNFALPISSAEGFIDDLAYALKKNEIIRFDNNARYASLNLCSLRTFGTIEYRSMRGLTNVNDIRAWVLLLSSFYEVSVKYNNPKEMFADSVDNIIPPRLFDFFSKDRIMEVYNSNLSNALALSYTHKTRWDFSKPDCDIRLNKPFIEWYCNARGISIDQVYQIQTRDLELSLAKYERETVMKAPDSEAFVTNFNQERIRIRGNELWLQIDDIEVV